MEQIYIDDLNKAIGEQDLSYLENDIYLQEIRKQYPELAYLTNREIHVMNEMLRIAYNMQLDKMDKDK